MKYKGKVDYPNIGDEIKVPRCYKPYTVVSASYGRFQQGDLVQGMHKGLYVVLGAVTSPNFNGRQLLIQRVFTDKLKPSKGGMDVVHPEWAKSARDFMLKEKKVHEEALKIIKEYTEE